MNSNVKTVNCNILGYAAAMALACGLIVSNAHAGDEARSETVKFADLDLSSSQGVEALYRRIHAAARRVCDQPAGEQAGVGRCMRKTEKRGNRQGERPIADRVLPREDRQPAANDHRESMKWLQGSGQRPRSDPLPSATGRLAMSPARSTATRLVTGRHPFAAQPKGRAADE